MKNKNKPPIFVKLVYELDKLGKGKAYIVNKWGRKLDVEISDFEINQGYKDIKLSYFGPVIDKIVNNIEIKFTGVIKAKNKYPLMASKKQQIIIKKQNYGQTTKR